MSKPLWMIRAGKDTERATDFLEQGFVSIGFSFGEDVSKFPSRDAVFLALKKKFPEINENTLRNNAGQLYRFAHEIHEDDLVLTYDSAARVYSVGTIGQYVFRPTQSGDHCHIRPVKWQRQVLRDNLSQTAKNSLGSILALFQVPEHVRTELLQTGTKDTNENYTYELSDEEITRKETLEELEQRAVESIKDRLVALDWEEMQEVIAGMLRAMGYKTKVSPRGADRGKDIVASPDGLGFEPPRIVVEVKHRQGTMGAPEIRSFLGGRHKDDKGLYVSTGSFSKEARYEAERASIPLTLMDIDDVVDAIVSNYDQMDSEVKALLPLRKLYWPI